MTVAPTMTPGPLITSPNGTLIFGNFINETQLLQIELGHVNDELPTQSFIPFTGDAWQVFLADSSMDKFVMGSCVVNGDEAISLKHVEEFV